MKNYIYLILTLLIVTGCQREKLNSSPVTSMEDTTVLTSSGIMTEPINNKTTTKATAAEMTHTMYNLAYRFSAGNQTIVVSGDTSFDEDLITLSEGADMLVIDCSLYRKNSDPTTSPAQVSTEPFYVHGAGAQRSDPKGGDTGSFPEAFGPQGDIRVVYNYVRCVRD